MVDPSSRSQEDSYGEMNRPLIGTDTAALSLGLVFLPGGIIKVPRGFRASVLAHNAAFWGGGRESFAKHVAQ